MDWRTKNINQIYKISDYIIRGEKNLELEEPFMKDFMQAVLLFYKEIDKQI